MLQEKLKDYHIILASKSPRRQALLADLDIKFDIQTKDIEERFPSYLKDEEVPVYLSKLKASAFEKDLKKNDMLITSDTVVSMDGKILGKPKDADEAKRMLQQLSGKRNKVITGVCIKTLEKTVSFEVATKVYFRELLAEEIDYYIEQYQPFDKAGAYGIQEWIGKTAIYRIKGCYFNVMGLPLQRLYHELYHF